MGNPSNDDRDPIVNTEDSLVIQEPSEILNGSWADEVENTLGNNYETEEHPSVSWPPFERPRSVVAPIPNSVFAISEGMHVFSLTDRCVFQVVKRISDNKFRCRGLRDFKFRPNRNCEELAHFDIPGMLLPKEAQDLQWELEKLRRQLCDAPSLNHELNDNRRRIWHLQSELHQAHRTGEKREHIVENLKTSVKSYETEITDLKMANTSLKRKVTEIGKTVERLRTERNDARKQVEKLKSKGCSGQCLHLKALNNSMQFLLREYASSKTKTKHRKIEVSSESSLSNTSE